VSQVRVLDGSPKSESGGTADAPGSGPGARKGVGVQIPPLAPLIIKAAGIFPELFAFLFTFEVYWFGKGNYYY
jgi:hypothetical protein